MIVPPAPKDNFLHIELANTVQNDPLYKCLPKMKHVKNPGFSAFHLEDEDKKTCRQLQGSESAKINQIHFGI